MVHKFSIRKFKVHIEEVMKCTLNKSKTQKSALNKRKICTKKVNLEEISIIFSHMKLNFVIHFPIFISDKGEKLLFDNSTDLSKKPILKKYFAMQKRNTSAKFLSWKHKPSALKNSTRTLFKTPNHLYSSFELFLL